jgi:hypothetical protein
MRAVSPGRWRLLAVVSISSYRRIDQMPHLALVTIDCIEVDERTAPEKSPSDLTHIDFASHHQLLCYRTRRRARLHPDGFTISKGATSVPHIAGVTWHQLAFHDFKGIADVRKLGIE